MRPSVQFLDRAIAMITLAFISERSSVPSSAERSYVADALAGPGEPRALALEEMQSCRNPAGPRNTGY
jgi:hypothetical protein